MPTQNQPATRDQRLAYVFLRVFTGFDFFGHGFARIFTGTHLAGFAQGMAKSMAAAPLPPQLVLATGYVVPCVELIVGILLLTGVFVREALLTASRLMLVLIFGVTMKQDWNVAGQQLLYALVLALLLFAREPYDISWPALFRSSPAGNASFW